MIIYDPHSFYSFFGLRGSVFPKAFWYALLPAVFASVLRYLHDNGMIDLEQWHLTTEQGIYQGFTFVLGFVSVFRASQSYARYWESARAVRKMGADWYDVAASLIAFANVSKKPEKDIRCFSHVVVRLICMLHAMALEEAVCVTDVVHFPVLDIEGISKEDLCVLAEESAQGRKVEIVNQWVKAHILNGLSSQVLSVPPPILTRVFQQLASGLQHYHEVLQVVIWPFPFPYAQMSCYLLAVHAILTPLVLAKTSSHAIGAGILTLTSVMCMKAIELIAAELENPFGHDANDLPTYELHYEMMQDLIFLVNPRTFKVPHLLPNAKLEYEELMQVASKELGVPLKRKKWDNMAIPKAFLLMNEQGKKMYNMTSWRSQKWSHASQKVATILQLDEKTREELKAKRRQIAPTGAADVALTVDAALEKNPEVVPSENEEKAEVQAPVVQANGSLPDAQKAKDLPWQPFLHELSESMQHFFSQQSEHLKATHERQLSALEQLLQQTARSGAVVDVDAGKPGSQSAYGPTTEPLPGRDNTLNTNLSGMVRI